MANNDDRHRRYWRANFRLIVTLLGLWAFISLGCGILWVELLNRIQIFSIPLGFWIAQQGSIYAFVAIIFFYAWRMDRIDHNYHEDE